MEPLIPLGVSLSFNCLLGVAMYFMKQNHDNTKERIAKLESNVDRIKDTTVKKEDFREFKEELWLRFDKMEVAFDKRLTELNKQ